MYLDDRREAHEFRAQRAMCAGAGDFEVQMKRIFDSVCFKRV